VDGRRRHRLGAAAPALAVWAAWLTAVVGLVAIAVATGAIASGPHHGMPGVVREGPLWPLRSWDFAWYARIADHGYPGAVGREHAFMPLWPLYLRAVRPLLGASAAAALLAVAASAAAFAGVAIASPLRDPRRVAIAAACLPGSFSLALLYPDGLALAAAVWACVLAARDRPLAAGVLGAVAAAARPGGFLVAIPLLAIARARGRPPLPALGPLVGAAGAYGYIAWRAGDVLAFVHAQRAWGRGRPWRLLTAPLDAARSGHLQTFVEMAVAALAVALCVAAWRRGRAFRPWALYATAVVGLSLGSGSFQSIGRQALLAFPLIWVAADSPLCRRRSVAVAGLAVNAGLIIALPVFAP
jgi:hypothetical protein